MQHSLMTERLLRPEIEPMLMVSCLLRPEIEHMLMVSCLFFAFKINTCIFWLNSYHCGRYVRFAWLIRHFQSTTMICELRNYFINLCNASFCTVLIQKFRVMWALLKCFYILSSNAEGCVYTRLATNDCEQITPSFILFYKRKYNITW